MENHNLSANLFGLHLSLSQLEEFKTQVFRYGINCVADLRMDGRGTNGEAKARLAEFKRFLNEQGISFHSFYDDMVRYNPLHHDKKGKWKYDLALKDEHVTAALERLMKGVSLGYVIAVMDDEAETAKSFSYKLVGQYFHERNVDMMYLCDNGKLVSHAAIIAMKEARKQKRLDANTLGTKGEELAVRYLEERGYVILDRNWNLHKGCEVDIVARKGDVFHFVEVKTRTNDKFSAPVAAINRKKMKNMCLAANAYRAKNGFWYSNFSIDSIGVVCNSKEDVRIDMYENIVSAGSL